MVELYHISERLFFEFSLNYHNEDGDLSDENTKGIYFSEIPIPYYPNRFVYKCQVLLNDSDIVKKYDKFAIGAEKYGEVLVTDTSRINIKEIAEVSPLEQETYHSLFREDKDWFEQFKIIFKNNKICL